MLSVGSFGVVCSGAARRNKTTAIPIDKVIMSRLVTVIVSLIGSVAPHKNHIDEKKHDGSTAADEHENAIG